LVVKLKVNGRLSDSVPDKVKFSSVSSSVVKETFVTEGGAGGSGSVGLPPPPPPQLIKNATENNRIFFTIN
jgi:hypothetical protein